jgi:PEGA domain
MMRSFALATAELLLVCSTLRAEPAVIVTAGKADARTQTIAEHAVADALRTAGWALADKPLSKMQAAAVEQCFKDATPPACVMRAVHDHGVRGVAYVVIDPDSANAAGVRVVARLVVATLPSVMSSEQFCDHCTDDTLITAASTATKAILDRYALESGRTVLSVKSSPQNARFSVDGQFVGVTDQSINITPGRHVVTIEHDGYQSETRTLEATEDKTAEVSVTMKPIGSSSSEPVESTTPHDQHTMQNVAPQTSPAIPHDDDQHSRALPIALVSIGGAAIVGGAIMIAFNETEPRSPAGQVQTQFYYSTVGPGIGVIAGGVVVGALGGYLWWRFAHTNTSPTVTPTAGGAVMSLRGSF